MICRTRRVLKESINGKICLHEIEVISDLVNAESEEKVNAINR